MNREENLINIAFAIAFATASSILFGCASVHHPYCGELRQRPWDGNWCRECVDANGSRFARCQSNSPQGNR